MISSQPGELQQKPPQYKHIHSEESSEPFEEQKNFYPNSVKRQPKINANKLPDAFSQKRTKPPLGEFKRKIESETDNRIFQQEQQKGNQKLSPMQGQQEKKADTDQEGKKDNATKKRSRKLSDNLQSKNPLTPLKNFMKNQKKINEELGIQQVKPTPVIQNQIKLSEMITLCSIRSHADQSPVKKMLHAPTMRLYIVKEEPLQSKEIRNYLKDWISFWQNSFNNSPLHLKINSTFWNQPEGYLYIVTEYLNGGSLQNLFDAVGFLPEKVIQQTASQIIDGLYAIHQYQGMCHGALAPSQILFNSEGCVQLSLGLSYRISQQNPGQQNSFNQSLLGKQNNNQNLFSQSESPKIWKKAEQTLDAANDVFKLGILILNCALGSLDIIDKSSIIYEFFEFILDQQNSKKILEQQGNYCCIIHHQEELLKLFDQIPTDNKSKRQKEQVYLSCSSHQLTLLNLLERHTPEFTDFLCQMLRISSRKRAKIEDLKTHPFIQTKIDRTPKIYLKDLLMISQNWNSFLPDEYQSQGEKKLDQICEALSIVLPQSEKQDLSHEIGITPDIVCKRLLYVYDQFWGS